MMTKEEKENLFYDNIKLAYKMANKYLVNYREEIEDIKQVALYALWKAAINYDETKNIRFSPFACLVISNEINYYLRPIKKKKSTMSINTPIYVKDGKGLLIEDALEEAENSIDILIDALTREELDECFEQINITPRQREIYSFYMNNDTKQRKIAEKFNVTQTYVSKIIKNTNNKIKEKYYYKRRNVV